MREKIIETLELSSGGMTWVELAMAFELNERKMLFEQFRGLEREGKVRRVLTVGQEGTQVLVSIVKDGE